MKKNVYIKQMPNSPRSKKSPRSKNGESSRKKRPIMIYPPRSKDVVKFMLLDNFVKSCPPKRKNSKQSPMCSALTKLYEDMRYKPMISKKPTSPIKRKKSKQ